MAWGCAAVAMAGAAVEMGRQGSSKACMMLGWACMARAKSGRDVAVGMDI